MVEDAGDLPDVSRYCCNRFKIINGAYMVAVSYCVFIMANLGIRFYKSAEVEWNWQIFFTACDSVSVACLFFGVFRKRAAFLQPFTVVSILTVSFFILLTLSYSTAAFVLWCESGDSYYGDQLEILLADKLQMIADFTSFTPKQVLIGAAVLNTIVCAGMVFIHVWFMIIVVHCALWLRKSAEQVTLVESLMLEAKDNSAVKSPSLAPSDVEKGVSYL